MIFHLTFEISNAGSPYENTVHNRSRAKEASVAGMIIIIIIIGIIMIKNILRCGCGWMGEVERTEGTEL